MDQTVTTGPSGILPPPPEPPRTRRTIIRIALGVVVLLVCGGGVTALVVGLRNATAGSTATAQVGSCLAGTTPEALNANALQVVACDSADATFRVVQTVDDTYYDDRDGACTDPATEFVFWSGRTDEKGYVLCLAQVRPS